MFDVKKMDLSNFYILSIINSFFLFIYYTCLTPEVHKTYDILNNLNSL